MGGEPLPAHERERDLDHAAAALRLGQGTRLGGEPRSGVVPGGIADAMYAIIWSMYGWGDAFVYITDRYSTGFPSAWTVLNPEPMTVNVTNGRRTYRSGQVELNPPTWCRSPATPPGR